MYVKREISSSIIFFFSWRPALRCTIWASFVYIVHKLTGWTQIIPFLPVATVGTAVAFYVGFKNHASYERLWEARKAWGGIVTDCRSFAILLSQYFLLRNPHSEIAARLLNLQLAWLNGLRWELRSKATFLQDVPRHVELVKKIHCAETETLEGCLSSYLGADEIAVVKTAESPTTALLKTQMDELMDLQLAGEIDQSQRSDFQKILFACIEKQGIVERINSFPFPRQYAYFSVLFIKIFCIFLPFGLLGELAKVNEKLTWLMIPFTVLIFWIFYTMEQVGDTSENPFDGGMNDVPINFICREVEIELKQLLGYDQLPERITPKEHILL